MAVSLNKSGARHAQALIREGKTVADERDDWSEHQPSAEDENRFIERHGMAEYGKWHLGIDDEKSARTKAHYKFPYCVSDVAERKLRLGNHEDAA